MTEGAPTPRVSIILSVRNGMLYLPEAIESIAGQTVCDWELVVNDNASEDGTAAYLEQCAASEPRIVYLRSTGDHGAGGGLNRALASARAPLIAVMDADDRALPRRLERQLQFMAQHPEIVACSCSAYYIDTLGRRVGTAHYSPTSVESYQQMRSASEPIALLHPGALIRREVLDQIGGYRQEFFPAEDVDLWTRLGDVGVVYALNERLMEYRVHAQATMSLFFDEARLKHEWVRACLIARQRGRAEPGWDDFNRSWQEAPIWIRFHRGRRILAERLCRLAREDFAVDRRLGGAAKLATAALLRPVYTAPRVRGHLLAGRSVVLTATPQVS
ncbi:MAG TPA: glycosyltransferase family A protein [Dehalococcoidia bacterium]|nr:glycosyltransferase family A protein [Dehalococcoidia bacterium]